MLERSMDGGQRATSADRHGASPARFLLAAERTNNSLTRTACSQLQYDIAIPYTGKSGLKTTYLFLPNPSFHCASREKS